jgi:hypothetical protein
METTRTLQSLLEADLNLSTEFVRISWTSDKAKTAWETIIRDANQFFPMLERESVKQGIRNATIQTFPRDDVGKYSYEFAKDNIHVIPIDKVQDSNTYQSSGSSVDESKPWSWKCAIGKFEESRELVYAYKNNDNKTIGDILGYPKCCINFFEETWITQHLLDTSLPMARGETDIKEWDIYCNILLRWLGVRLVSHLPCSFTCEATGLLGRQMYDLAASVGRRTTADNIKEMLSWPIEWSGLHGIGLITTPVFRITVRTDMFRKNQVVRLHSAHFPMEAEYGLKFPFKTKKYNANGFVNDFAQIQAHNLILDVLKFHEPKSVIDLGCGDGALLCKMKEDFGSITCGVDMEPEKLPNTVANIFDLDGFDDDYELALISRARIKENPEGWLKLLKIIEYHCKMLLIYSYDGDHTAVPLGSFTPIIGIADHNNVADLYGKTKAA